MSIRAKLSLAISLIVGVVLILNILFSQLNAVRVQDENVEIQISTMAKQLAISVELIESTNKSIETELAHRLKSAAQAAEQLLPPDIEDVTLEQLTQVRQLLGLTDITLWVLHEQELVSQISTNPAEVNLRSKTWDYWDTAMKDVIHLRPVSVEQGQIMQNFYSGPVNFAVTDPSQINKWGYYYSGNTNYMINTILNTDQSFSNGYINNKENIVESLMSENPTLLEITAFDPEFFGKDKIIKLKQGQPIYNLDVRDVRYGTYNYNNVARDVDLVHQSLKTGKFVSSSFTVDDRRLTRTFTPIFETQPYIISMVFDEQQLLSGINKQFSDHMIISLMLLILTILGSYKISELLTAPLTKIMEKVNAVSMNNFTTPLEHNSKDELGLLANQVNTMGHNLFHYTEQLKQTNDQLLSTKQYLESFFFHTKDAIHIMDLNFNVVKANQAFLEMFEYTFDELIGRPLFTDPDLPQQHKYDDLLLQLGELNGITDYETVMYSRSGKPIDVSISLSGIKDDQGNIIAYASITRNITQRKHYEELRHNNEKLSAIGQMAASIAHEIRNPLTTIKGFLSLNFNKGSIPQQHMELVMQEIMHMNVIIEQFLSMSRPQSEQWGNVNIEQLIRDIITLMVSSGKLENINVRIVSDPQQTCLNGSEQHLKQVFVNLINNCYEAMPDGGKLFITIQKQLQQQQLSVTIEDTGVGMSADQLKQLFQPFYTSKQNGNGLGLLVSQQIIANHRGSITFESELNKGTRAIIILPTEVPN